MVITETACLRGSLVAARIGHRYRYVFDAPAFRVQHTPRNHDARDCRSDLSGSGSRNRYPKRTRTASRDRRRDRISRRVDDRDGT